tara:strand:- start:21378 stop:21617 length:240 start_codon:yes stop_codon:yes gene_type:complete
MAENKKLNLAEKGWSLTKSLMRYAMQGFPNVSEKVYEDRMMICNSCELLNKEKGACMACGCAVEYKGRMETESCPKKKW